MNTSAAIANTLWAASNLPAYARFSRALREPHVAQMSRLMSYLQRNARTPFGATHRFESIRTYDQFTRRVPLNNYDTLQPWIERVRGGETNALTSDPITHLVPTSGSSGGRKLIPFTLALQQEFNAAIGPWLIDLARQSPTLLGGSAYWSVTPVLEDGAPEQSAVPIGFDSDTSYLGGNRRRLADAVMAVPAALQRSDSLRAFRYQTLLWLLRSHDLRLISVWHPTFLTLLLDCLPECWEDLIKDVKTGRNREKTGLRATQMPRRARELVRANPCVPGSLWPRLKLISCWSDGPAELAASSLRERFPGVTVQSKGLIATEAFVSLPFRDQHLLAVCSHFFEFIDAGGEVRPAAELTLGEEYEVVVTTGGGLWRYRLGDRVRVEGFAGKTPSLRFLGRDSVVDLFGEKLTESFVTQAVNQLLNQSAARPSFALVAPDHDDKGCRYTLYVEGRPEPGWADALDQALHDNPHYSYCRKLGQLRSVQLFHVEERGYELFAKRLAGPGARLGDVKPVALSGLSGWSSIFPGGYFEGPGLCSRI